MGTKVKLPEKKDMGVDENASELLVVLLCPSFAYSGLLLEPIMVQGAHSAP